MDSIIFDLDGTLWDPIDTVKDAWNETILSYRPEEEELTRKDLEGIMGLQIEGIGEKLFSHLEKEEREKIINACFDAETEVIRKQGARLYPGLEETLQHLEKKYPLFIVSNCQDGYIEAFYEAHGLENYFNDYENPGRTGLPKGENIKLVMERNGLKKPVYIGDTSGDEKAARHAGIPFYYASYGFGQAESFEKEIERITDLKEMV
ncbi:HAD family hydrolase [Salimicrobium halophilum]|uniref:Phosphoglycolate phosphatase n=1 Tax=Salimicrobium halophilum TaxID=86666 RepID=A0A1G8R8L6_9BACI|nr:HAD family hydrolase [Salimicrobium halophilum]SDJ13384.1 phosphoglycolate phosphatase [Salimicrobium halophilum]